MFGLGGILGLVFNGQDDRGSCNYSSILNAHCPPSTQSFRASLVKKMLSLTRNRIVLNESSSSTQMSNLDLCSLTMGDPNKKGSGVGDDRDPESHDSPDDSSLMFLNVSNPADSQSKQNKRLVKRWASTNPLRPPPSNLSEGQVGTKSKFPSRVGPPRGKYRKRGSEIPRLQQEASFGEHSGHESPSTSSSTPQLKAIVPKRQDSSREVSQGPSDARRQPRGASGRRQESYVQSERSLRSEESDPGESSSGQGQYRRLLPATSGSTPSTSPQQILSATSGDPFNTLPVQSGSHGDELLQLYLNVSFISPAWVQNMDSDLLRQNLSLTRRSVWLPLALQSKTAHSALCKIIHPLGPPLFG